MWQVKSGDQFNHTHGNIPVGQDWTDLPAGTSQQVIDELKAKGHQVQEFKVTMTPVYQPIYPAAVEPFGGGADPDTTAIEKDTKPDPTKPGDGDEKPKGKTK